MKKTLNRVAQNLSIIRKQKKITQQELAEDLSLSVRTIQKYESSDSDLKLSTVEKISSVLGPPPCFFFKEVLIKAPYHCEVEILDFLHIGVQVNDLNGLIIYANNFYCETMGLTKEELLGKKYIWSFLPHEEQEKLKEYFKVLKKDRPTPTMYFTKNYTHRKGLVPIKVDWRYMENKNKDLTGFLSIITPHPSW